MAMHRPRLVTLVALGLGMTAALPNVRYPPLSKMPTSKLKKQGKCYQVTHTFETAFGLDKLPRLDPEATESNLLVDRFDGSLVSDACRSTQVLLSLPTDDTDMGSFKKTTGWAAQAIQLVAGSIVVDYAMLDANLAREYRRAEARRKKWTNKRNNTTSISPVREAMFMMYFECPSAPSEKGRKPREYSVAMTHIDQATVMLALSPYMAFAQLARNAKGTDPLNDQGFWQLASDQRLPAGHSDDGTGWVGETATSISVHDPLCPRIRVAGYSGFCYMFKRIQVRVALDARPPMCSVLPSTLSLGLIHERPSSFHTLHCTNSSGCTISSTAIASTTTPRVYSPKLTSLRTWVSTTRVGCYRARLQTSCPSAAGACPTRCPPPLRKTRKPRSGGFATRRRSSPCMPLARAAAACPLLP